MTQEFTSRAFFPERSFKTGSLLGAASCRVHCLHLRPFIMQYIPCPLPPRNGDALCVTLHLGLWAQLITNFRLVLVTNLIFLIHSLLLPPSSLSLASIVPTTFDMAKTDPKCIAKKKQRRKISKLLVKWQRRRKMMKGLRSLKKKNVSRLVNGSSRGVQWLSGAWYYCDLVFPVTVVTLMSRCLTILWSKRLYTLWSKRLYLLSVWRFLEYLLFKQQTDWNATALSKMDWSSLIIWVGVCNMWVFVTSHMWLVCNWLLSDWSIYCKSN